MTIASHMEFDGVRQRFVRFGAAEIAVPEDDHGAAVLTVRAALWMVQYWGLVSVDAVAERARASRPHFGANASLVSRLLSATPNARWLDWPDCRWFSLTAPRSQLQLTINKVLSIAPRVRIEDLREGLSKALPAVADAPYGVLEQYLRQIAGCAVAGATVRAADERAVADATLSPAESGLVAILQEAGGAMGLTSLRRGALAASLPEATTRRLLKTSPLFLHRRDGVIRLIGGEPGPQLVRAAAYRATPQALYP